MKQKMSNLDIVLLRIVPTSVISNISSFEVGEDVKGYGPLLEREEKYKINCQRLWINHKCLSTPPETVFLLWKINKKYTLPPFLYYCYYEVKAWLQRTLAYNSAFQLKRNTDTHTHILTDLVIHLLPGKPKPEVRVPHIYLPPLWLVYGYHSPLSFIYETYWILFTFWYAFLFNFFFLNEKYIN